MEQTDSIRDNTGGLGLTKPPKSERLTTVPNLLTALRVLLTPVFLYLIFSDRWYLQASALLVFIAASLTDFYDGRIARRDKTITRVGRFMDPLADKLLVSSALVAFVLLGMVEAWLVVVMLVRDLGITCLRIHAVRQGRPVVTSRLAKWKTMLQLVLVFGILIFINIRVILAELTSQPLVLAGDGSYLVLNILVAGVTLLALVAGVRYLIDRGRSQS